VTRIAVITADVLADRMAGPAIRALHIAEELGTRHDVTLISTAECSLGRPGIGCRHRTALPAGNHSGRPQRRPGSELAAVYTERREFESLLDEMEIHHSGHWVVLRSKSGSTSSPTWTCGSTRCSLLIPTLRN
jgi:hypothetical protein